ncbi:MAG: glycosyltransferase family 9 protein, partial [Proteobacteria bacterium]
YRQQSAAIALLFSKLGITQELVKTIALFPGSVWATKRWTEEGFVQAGNQLREEGHHILVMGGPGEEELCARVAALIPGAKNICGQTSIYESALVLSRIGGVIGNDSASLHLAATSQCPSVVMFGPTVLRFGFRPWQDQVAVVEMRDLACRPCGKHGHQVCPIGTHICMKGLEASIVTQKLKELTQ